ncbi:glutathione S-transferase omega-1-like isoform X10 [Bubalus kerabau]|uniref:glutathione S-transferase omega-1-like isoform X10 n=1 Tax=Bubalus carabanensis TaxID=3119969 RepID=UPI00244E89F9|nr:glutathione S-transferase omega-1-like isoform X10 [Bubalus carabanensis]
MAGGDAVTATPCRSQEEECSFFLSLEGERQTIPENGLGGTIEENGKRAPGARPRGPDPCLQHEVLSLRQEDAPGPEGQGNPVPSLMVSFLRKQNKEDCSGLEEELHKEFSKLEEVLTNKKTTFFGGNSLSMIDYLIWPWFEWLEALELNEYVEHTPNLKLWMASMKNDPIVSSLPTDVKTLQGFFNLYLQNSPEACDYGL